MVKQSHCDFSEKNAQSLRTLCDPVSCQIQPERSVAPIKFFSDDVIHHRHVQVNGVVQEQGIDGTLYHNTMIAAQLFRGQPRIRRHIKIIYLHALLLLFFNTPRSINPRG